MSFAYGADSALAYDTLKSLRRKEEYQKVEGNANGMRHLGFAVFAPIGGFLATMNLALPYLASSIGIFISGLIGLTLVEPPREKGKLKDWNTYPDESRTVQTSNIDNGFVPSDPARQAGKKSYYEIRKSLGLLLEQKKILWLVLFFSLIFLATRMGFWTYQPYMKMVGVPLSLFGIVIASFHLFSALMSRYAHRIERGLKERLTLLVMPILVVISFLLLSRFLFLWSISFIFIQQVTTAIHEPVLKNYLNRHTPSEIRATMLSVQHMVGNATFAIFAPFLGSLVDRWGLQNALLIFALVVIIFSSFLWWLRIRWFRPTKILT
jgi:MFS family permease